MKLKLLAPSLLLLTTAPAAFAAFPGPPSPYTHTAQVAQGPWDDPNTWQKAPGVNDNIPGDDAVVLIPAGDRVTVRRQEGARIKFIRVDGELRLWIHQPTLLKVETLYIGPYDPGRASTGIFRIGAACCPVKPGVTAEVRFISDLVPLWNKTSWDPQQLSRGLVSDGQVRLYGQDKVHLYTVSHDAPAGTTSLTLDLAPNETVPRGWNQGDKVVLTGTYFRRTGAATSSEDELRTITTQPTGSSIAIAPLTYDHLRPRSDLDLHVADLTRNILITSESTNTPDRGHVMFRNGDVDIENVEFIGVGRTDKSIPLDDVVVNADGTVSTPLPGAVHNPRGRYAVHFHRNGIQPGAAQPPSKVYGCVVVDTPGWGFVNHQSHVDFQRNAVWNFVGAAFVTEAGNELGNFFDNIAIRGSGNGQYRPQRIVFKNAQRPQPLSDFGFGGDGFWFQGPALRVRDNVANGCDGAGMIWFTAGAPDIQDVGPDGRNNYTGFDRTAAETVYGVSTSDPSFTPRYWNNGVGDQKLVIADLPILEMDGLDSYANLVGFRLRFNNHNDVDLYLEDPYDYDQDIVPLHPGDNRYAVRLRQSVSNLRLWNDEEAFRATYNSKTDWSAVTAINRLGYDVAGAPFRGHAGADINFQILNSTLTGVTIDGYPVAGWVENGNEYVRNQLTFAGQTYDNYAQFDTWNKNGLSCAAPGSVFAQAGTTSATLSWVSTNTKDERYLVRYRAIGAPQWRMVDTTGTSVAVGGLARSTQYEVQMVAGCCAPDKSGNCGPNEFHSLSPWSAAATFTTN